jgi:hypothetical protein
MMLFYSQKIVIVSSSSDIILWTAMNHILYSRVLRSANDIFMQKVPTKILFILYSIFLTIIIVSK